MRSLQPHVTAEVDRPSDKKNEHKRKCKLCIHVPLFIRTTSKWELLGKNWKAVLAWFAEMRFNPLAKENASNDSL